MADRFFSRADELRAVVASASNDVDFLNLVDQLQIEFAMLGDEFKLMNENERVQEVEVNAKHVYFSVGLNLVERAMEMEITPSFPCAQQLENSQQQGQKNASNTENVPMQVGQLTVDPDNASALINDVPMNNEQNCGASKKGEISVQLSYRDFVQLVHPIYGIRGMQTATVQSIRLVIEAIEDVRVRAITLKYNLENDERALVTYIHGVLDATTQELWEWHVLDHGVATLLELIHFLRMRIQRMPKASSRSSSVSEDWNEPSTSAGMLIPPKRAKKNGCYKCGLAHGLCQCPTFKSMSLPAKTKFVHQKKLCLNCFSIEHMVATCPDDACRKCNIKHNSLLCPKNPTNY